MINQKNQITYINKNLLNVQKCRVEKLYGIYLDAMKIAFDEGNLYIKSALASGSCDLNEALKVRSNHINSIARKYEEFNIESLAHFFKVSTNEIRNATNFSRR